MVSMKRNYGKPETEKGKFERVSGGSIEISIAKA